MTACCVATFLKKGLQERLLFSHKQIQNKYSIAAAVHTQFTQISKQLLPVSHYLLFASISIEHTSLDSSARPFCKALFAVINFLVKDSQPPNTGIHTAKSWPSGSTLCPLRFIYNFPSQTPQVGIKSHILISTRSSPDTTLLSSYHTPWPVLHPKASPSKSG